MRIDELRLLAFGPFTDKVISLNQGSEGLHLVYGPNEAGKSSALRAIHGLLYGISERSADNFIHHYSKLRIGGVLRSGGGDQLSVVRRKGRVNTLRQEDDATIVEDSRLARFLGGIDETLFNSMFGIDNEKLVHGGREIVAGGGDLGHLIFSAGSGIINLRQLQDRLKADAEALFKPSGQKPRINVSLSNLNQLRKQLRDTQLPGEKWMLHHKNLSGAEERKTVVESELNTYQVKIHRFKRFQEAFPIISRRRELMEEFQVYKTTVLLPEDFPEKRRQLISRLEVAEHKKKQSHEAIVKLKAELAGLDIPDDLLAQFKLIEEIQQEVGSHRKAGKDRGDLVVRRRAYQSEAREILQGLRNDLTLEEAEKLRIRKEESVRISDLATEFERIHTRIMDAREALPKLREEINQSEEELNVLGASSDTGALQIALGEAVEYGSLEKSNQAELDDIKSALKLSGQEKIKSGLGDKTFEEIGKLQIPSLETIHHFEKRFNLLETALSEKQKEREKAQHNLNEVEKNLEIIRSTHDVPARKDLEKIRSIRDQGWQLILKDWKTGVYSEAEIKTYLTAFPGFSELDEAFEHLVQEADSISDRLNREADRVAEKARLSADRASYVRQIEDLGKDMERHRQEETQLQTAWVAAWPDLKFEIKTPKEMERWVQNLEKWMDKARECIEKHRKADLLKQAIDTHRAKLLQALQPFSKTVDLTNETLARIIKSARVVIDEEKERSAKREQLWRDTKRKENDLKTAQYRLAENEKNLQQWEKQWEAAVRPLGLTGNSRPSEASAVMGELQSLFSKLKEAEILRQRIHGIDRDAEAFAKKVSALTDTIAKDLYDRTPAEAAIEINQRLHNARRAQSIQESLKKQLHQEKDHIKKTDGELSGVEASLKRMCEDAGRTDYRQLPEAEKNSAVRSRIENELHGVDQQLRKLSGGVSVDDFIRGASIIDPDAITGEIKHLEETIDYLENEKESLNQTIGAERTRLGEMNGNATAADLAEEIQILLGGLENDVDQYARLKIEAFILNKAVERYREKSEGPILKRASELFNRITGGSFDGIRAEFDSANQPVVVGVRRKNEIVPVAGMSDGAADQLYLSLRLAGLEIYLKDREAMPFIVDDIFIKFDDDRAVTSLQALAEVSKSTQVICFTHHQHIVELANKTLDSALLFNHAL